MHKIPENITDLDKLKDPIVIIGAGPTGLMSAIRLHREGHKNIVLIEKRSHFTRLNIVNLHREILTLFKELCILDDFLLTASEITCHREYVYSNSNVILKSVNNHEEENFELLSNGLDFNPENMPLLFNHDCIYAISLADLQKCLAEIVIKLGIPLFPQTTSYCFLAEEKTYSVELMGNSFSNPVVINKPKLVIVANGSESDIFKKLGGKYISMSHSNPNEHWLFGNYELESDTCFVNSLIERGSSDYDYRVTNYIFLSAINEVNIATRIKEEDLKYSSAENILQIQADKINSMMNITSKRGKLRWITEQPVKTDSKTADTFYLGNNLVFIGDTAGTCSPISGLGCTLGVSAHQYAIKTLVNSLEKQDRKLALDQYSDRIKSYVNKWNNNTARIYNQISTKF